jgi:membrane protease YdiL (CAAX protease family)
LPPGLGGHRVDCPRPVGWQSLLALAVPVGLQLAALCISATAGRYEFDLTGLSGFRAEFAPETIGQEGIPVAALAGFLGTIVLGMVLWLPMSFGEELGWQGYLLPRLAALGTLRSLLVTSVIVAMWHLPTLFLGGQYPGHSLLESIAYMLIGTMLLVPIFCWLRMRFDSVWPVVLAHTVVSSVNIRLVWLLADAESVAGDALDPLHVGLNGWPGWLVTGAFVAVLAATGQFR